MKTTISLFDALQNDTRGTNGMPAFKSTGSNLLDFFAKAGDSRNLDLSGVFDKAFNENEEIALRTLLWTRDIRGGAGERKTFRDLVARLVNKDVANIEGFISLIPEVGRWDDVLILLNTKHREQVLSMIQFALLSGDGLCAKWMPRQGSTAGLIRSYMGYSPKQYRKLVVGLTQVVETQMCNREWGNITYEHVPSKAIGKYAKAFGRNDGTRFSKFKEKAVNGEVKVNAGAVFPCDVVALLSKDEKLAEAQWMNLPNYLEGIDERILCVVDVSGSMSSKVGGTGAVSCMDVAISLGIYTSQRLSAPFKDSFITFTDKPSIVTASGSLRQRVNAAQAHVGYNTNLEGVFDAVLKKAVQYNLPEDAMPTKIVIISDMQFDAQIHNFNASCMQMIFAKYAKAGYNVPSLVYWNCGAAKYGKSPFTLHDTGACIVSGFSPSILTSVLQGETDSISVMLKTVGKERYNYLA